RVQNICRLIDEVAGDKDPVADRGDLKPSLARRRCRLGSDNDVLQRRLFVFTDFSVMIEAVGAKVGTQCEMGGELGVAQLGALGQVNGEGQRLFARGQQSADHGGGQL